MIRIFLSIFAFAMFAQVSHASDAAFSPEQSCGNSPKTLTEMYDLFMPGEAEAKLGRSEIHIRTRRCHTRTGCGAWAPGGALLVPGSFCGSRINNYPDDVPAECF